MFFRKSKLIQKLREEIQSLREALAHALGERDAFKEIARQAIEVAHERHFLDPYSLEIGQPELRRIWVDSKVVYENPDYLPDPDPFSVKFCPECSVSVRSDSWPQECPACHCTFGFEGME